MKAHIYRGLSCNDGPARAAGTSSGPDDPQNSRYHNTACIFREAHSQGKNNLFWFKYYQYTQYIDPNYSKNM